MSQGNPLPSVQQSLWVGRHDVLAVFSMIWTTLEFMNRKNSGHTPLAGRMVGFFGKFRQFDELIEELVEDINGRNAS